MKKLLSKITWVIMAIPMVYLAIVWNQLPATVALHFNASGEPDRYGNKTELLISLLILTAINIGTYLVLTNMHRIDPKKFATANKDRVKRIAVVVSLFLSLITCFIIYTANAGEAKLMTKFVFSAVGLLFAFLGNYMMTLKPNYFAGIRVPWTLEDPENWRKTHLMAGKLWFAGGLLIAAFCLFLPSALAFSFFISVTILISLVPCIYSYRLFRQKKLSINK